MSKREPKTSGSGEVEGVARRRRGRPVGGAIGDSPIAREIGAWLAREGLSYVRAGELLGVHAATVQRWASGDVSPSPAMLRTIERVVRK